VLAAKEWLLRSADELDFLSGERMAESLEVVAAIAATVDGARRTTNLEPYGESQVGRRELKGARGGASCRRQMAMHWVVNPS
jgi:aminopeptidase-like protein